MIQKVLPDIARTKKSAEAHFRDFKNSNLEDAVLESDFLLPVVGQSQKKAMEQVIDADGRMHPLHLPATPPLRA